MPTVLSTWYADTQRWAFPNRLQDEVKDQTLGRLPLSQRAHTFHPGLLQSSQEELSWELLLLKAQAAFTAWQGQRYPPAEQEKRGESFFFYSILYSDGFIGLFVLTYV